MSGVVFLTGATGFLGTQIARRLLKDTFTLTSDPSSKGREGRIIALVRADNQEDAVRRLSRAWWDWSDLVDAIGERVEVLRGDVSLPRFGLDNATYDDLARRVTHIIHSAADLRLEGPINELRRTNVQGTANVLELARTVHRDHGLARLSHVSTAYVAGGRKGTVPEDSLTDEFGFSNAYELSKYEGELLVQEAKNELPISVFRPGMVIGDSRTGAIKTFNTLYFPLRLYLKGRLRLFPLSSSLRVNLVPVDYVADAVTLLTFESRAEGLNFHLTAPHESLPTAGELLEFVRQWARKCLGLTLPRPFFIPMPWLARLGRPSTPAPLPKLGEESLNSRRENKSQRVAQRKKSVFASFISLAPYFDERRRFQRDNIDRLLGSYEINWREILPPILEYAVYMGFLHRSDRTVHEQILFRLESKSRPVTYHDVVGGNVVTRSAFEVRRDILSAAGALRFMGITPGDRVALVGFNSTRYLTLDVAIGLVGAVSVSLYYTSPPAEIDRILSASGSRLLFIGTPKLLEKLGEFTAQLPIVSFCRDPIPEGLPQKVMSWDEFLALGAESKAPIAAPVSFGDTATLRYTSGTTGQPKGAVFKHENLRWMAESLASLIPWQVRNTKVSYLSFLPMNHVVEGILAAYSPYYLPAPVNLYFLDDFRSLQDTLPRVRPTIFFSVPRFYEKMWESLLRNRIGRWYVGSKDGLGKWVLRPLIRQGLLRRAGLDRCVWLIVGSAPPSEELLKAFHELGIEIHNGYGLTEAPLVTINRLGANRLSTVGEPLPQTQVRIAEDEEVMVCGPQMTAGYFGEGTEALFRDGWLLTGDLGYLTDEGFLVIVGRKKELIKTSYGKYIYPMKVEMMLREIPGVSEAMLVGDSKPYCVALLWVKDDYRDEASAEAIARGVGEVNTRLSHPEQVKRWAILANDLSIEGGDLTANLKLKRQAVARRVSEVIEALYRGETPPRDAKE